MKGCLSSLHLLRYQNISSESQSTAPTPSLPPEVFTRVHLPPPITPPSILPFGTSFLYPEGFPFSWEDRVGLFPFCFRWRMDPSFHIAAPPTRSTHGSVRIRARLRLPCCGPGPKERTWKDARLTWNHERSPSALEDRRRTREAAARPC